MGFSAIQKNMNLLSVAQLQRKGCPRDKAWWAQATLSQGQVFCCQGDS